MVQHMTDNGNPANSMDMENFTFHKNKYIKGCLIWD